MNDLSNIQAALKEMRYEPSAKMIDDVCRNVRLNITQKAVETSILDWFKIVAFPMVFAVTVMCVSLNTSPQANDAPTQLTLQENNTPFEETTYTPPLLAQSLTQIDYAAVSSDVLF